MINCTISFHRFVCFCKHTHILVYIYIYTCIHIHIYIYIYIYIYTYIYTYIYISMMIYVYIYTHTHYFLQGHMRYHIIYVCIWQHIIFHHTYISIFDWRWFEYIVCSLLFSYVFMIIAVVMVFSIFVGQHSHWFRSGEDRTSPPGSAGGTDGGGTYRTHGNMERHRTGRFR